MTLQETFDYPLLYQGMIRIAIKNGMAQMTCARLLLEYKAPREAYQFAEEELKGLSDDDQKRLAIDDNDDALYLAQRCPFAHQIFVQWFAIIST